MKSQVNTRQTADVWMVFIGYGEYMGAQFLVLDCDTIESILAQILSFYMNNQLHLEWPMFITHMPTLFRGT